MTVIISTISGKTYPVDTWKVAGNPAFSAPIEADLYLAVADPKDFVVIRSDAGWETIISCAHIESIARFIND